MEDSHVKYVLSAIVENEPGVLARIVGIISGRGYNIETLNVAPSADAGLSRLTMTVGGDAHVIEQVTKQLNKIIDVVKVTNLTREAHLERELVLVEVAIPKGRRGELLEVVTLFHADVVGVRESSLSIQFVGGQDQIDDFLRMLRPYTVIDLARSGRIAVARGDA